MLIFDMLCFLFSAVVVTPAGVQTLPTHDFQNLTYDDAAAQESGEGLESDIQGAADGTPSDLTTTHIENLKQQMRTGRLQKSLHCMPCMEAEGPVCMHALHVKRGLVLLISTSLASANELARPQVCARLCSEVV